MKGSNATCACGCPCSTCTCCKYACMHTYIPISLQCVWLGLRHVRYGARPQHIMVLGQVVISTLERAVGEEWTAEMDKAWTDLWQASCKMMLAVCICVFKFFFFRLLVQFTHIHVCTVYTQLCVSMYVCMHVHMQMSVQGMVYKDGWGGTWMRDPCTGMCVYECICNCDRAVDGSVCLWTGY